MANPTVKLSVRAYSALKQMSSASGESMQTILDRAVEAERRRSFFEEANASYARLKSDTQAWAEYRTELESWDATLPDGLEPEEQ